MASQVQTLKFNLDCLLTVCTVQMLPPVTSDMQHVCPAYPRLIRRMIMQEPSNQPTVLKALEALGNMASG